ncbi:Putative bifunctional phosphatase/peptidyl-prolyl cis-trans isomerase [Corynebacterium kalinowskii]|uniref:Bifunctional phosphatase/peptidyl-prolyl cis-trans isomerase n=1 Tax=Corynebacterium kalinowskii TaxID=2675216 RepID=A0A6B8VL16_9CORY|nr:peptidylprolyl isomerase [Corynebacterium kalinowskii]QGU02134.1 Putative bifunctional phosphatase/peptidyl-prolyl cis-trans isomerase [Corynebacterium kalinowskii]
MTSNKQRREQALRNLDRELKNRERAEKAKPLGVIVTAALVILALVGGIWFAATRNSDPAENSAQPEPTVEQPQAQPLTMKRASALPEKVSCQYPEAGQSAKPVSVPTRTADVSTTGTVKLNLDTTAGPIGLELDRAASPCTVNAIEHLAYNGYYDDTVCHRITTNGIYVLQCGDPTGTGTGGPGFSFANEYPTDEMPDAPQVIYPRGSLAMANSGPDTNGSQFFLNYQDSPLQANYTYFGRITDEGLGTLDKIAANGAEGGAPDGKPAQEVRITKANLG